MDFTFQNTSIIVLTLLTGLSAGLSFTWANTITTGIGNLDNYGYLSAFQQMNRTILNLPFFIVFFGPFVLGLVNLYSFKNAPSSLIGVLISATIIYFLGVVLVTIFGNVPLNEVLDKTDLISASNEDLKALRNIFEAKWNRLHLIRTVSSIGSFFLLILILLVKK
ncbi:DUF1772 domain-containing protein [uncultured Algibacter sp.]|uniref:anthrone oxygenase family protein n=1 Tax=uncultured Algibacter sp. TaxID=298659 RepID=UPI00263770B5|nr:DUF1772 domain-containing protein [uncultured Algibacter sp.]